MYLNAVIDGDIPDAESLSVNDMPTVACWSYTNIMSISKVPSSSQQIPIGCDWEVTDRSAFHKPFEIEPFGIS